LDGPLGFDGPLPELLDLLLDAPLELASPLPDEPLDLFVAAPPEPLPALLLDEALFVLPPPDLLVAALPPPVQLDCPEQPVLEPEPEPELLPELEPPPDLLVAALPPPVQEFCPEQPLLDALTLAGALASVCGSGAPLAA
jgi:hypothetical protein